MYSQIENNKRKSILLIGVFVLFVLSFGWLLSNVLGDGAITVGLFVFAIAYALIGYFMSAKIALALTGAREITKDQYTRLWRIVENLAIAGGLPMPKVYVIEDAAPNAFATGRDPQHGVVAVTTGLLESLDDQELEGVIAHELSHIGNLDIRVMGIVLVLVSIVAVISDVALRLLWHRDNRETSNALMAVGVIAALSAPFVAVLLKLSVSRKREYLADASGALLTRYPEGLASALEKIAAYDQPMRKGSPSTAHLFFANPLKTEKGKPFGLSALFSTHPPIAERVKVLRDMGDKL